VSIDCREDSKHCEQRFGDEEEVIEALLSEEYEKDEEGTPDVDCFNSGNPFAISKILIFNLILIVYFFI